MTERLAYEVLRTEGAFELRRYGSYLTARVRVRAADPASATNEGFSTLANYIFGSNHESGDIEMTVPVTAERTEGRRIEMTAPVTAEAAGSGSGGYVVSFIMPRRFASLGELPQPDDPRVTLAEVPGHVAAVVGFGGYLADASCRRWLQELGEWMERNGLRSAGEPIAAQFDGPWKPPFARHNEVIVPVVWPEEDTSGTEPPGVEKVDTGEADAAGVESESAAGLPDVDRTQRRSHPAERAADYPRPPSITRENLRVRAVAVGRMEPQPGHFFGGWVVSWVEGSFKGAPGTNGW